MLAFRKNIMDVILHTPDSLTIEYLVKDLLHHRFENMSSEQNRFLKLLESDATFQLRQINSKKTERNLIETQRVIKKIIEEKNVTASGKTKGI